MGIMAGVGIGLIIGGIVGYVSKGTALKEEQRKKAFKQMQKDKIEFEKQQQKIAKQEQLQREQEAHTKNNDQNYI